MNIPKINLKKIVEGHVTYPSWTTNSIYTIKIEENEKNALVYYTIKTNKKISRIFPKEISLTPRLMYILGILKGEGSNALGKSNYRRFTITNSDSNVIRLVLNELEQSNLFKKVDLINKSVHLLHHTEQDDKVIDYWSNELNIPKIKFKCFDDKLKTSKFGVCHVYISDVLLRRVIDILQEKLLDFKY